MGYAWLPENRTIREIEEKAHIAGIKCAKKFPFQPMAIKSRAKFALRCNSTRWTLEQKLAWERAFVRAGLKEIARNEALYKGSPGREGA